MTDRFTNLLENTCRWCTRRRINLVLFVALTGLAVTWFHRHFHLYVTQILVIGGSLSLWGLWQLLLSAWQQGGTQDSEGWFGRLLDSPRGTGHLAFGLMLFTLLSLATSSVYLIHQGAAAGEEKFEVEVRHQGNRYLPKTTLFSYDRVAGRPMPLELVWKRELEFKITSPPGFRPLSRTIYPWTSLHLKVPADFQREQLVSLIPSLSLYPQLPAIENRPTVQYDLTLHIGQRRVSIPDLRRQIVHTGSAQLERLQRLHSKDTKEALRKAIAEQAQVHNMKPEDQNDILRILLLEEQAHWELLELNAGDRLHIRIVSRPLGDTQASPEPVFCDTLELPESPHHVILLGSDKGAKCTP